MLKFVLFVDLMKTCLLPQISTLVLAAKVWLVCGLDEDLFVPTG